MLEFTPEQAGELLQKTVTLTGQVVEGLRQRESARAAAVALEQECAALARTLERFTHEYIADPRWPGYCDRCMGRADDLPHQTPAWLRKRYGLGV